MNYAFLDYILLAIKRCIHVSQDLQAKLQNYNGALETSITNLQDYDNLNTNKNNVVSIKNIVSNVMRSLTYLLMLMKP